MVRDSAARETIAHYRAYGLLNTTLSTRFVSVSDVGGNDGPAR